MRTPYAWLVMPILAGGCVSMGEHETLQKQHAQTLADLKDRDERLTALEKTKGEVQSALEAEQAKSAELDARIRELEANLAGVVKDKSSLQASVQEMKAALAESQRRKQEVDARIAEFRGLLARFKTLIDAGRLKVKLVNGRMVVVLATDVLFPSGSANLSKDGKAALAEVTGLLAAIPQRQFQVEGHTDNVPINTAQYRSNWELAASRALTVVRTMLEAGMPEDRISAASYGQSSPAAGNDSPEGRTANRRIEITIVPDLSTLPGVEELNKMQKGSS